MILPGTFVQLINQRPLQYIQMTSNLLSLSIVTDCWLTKRRISTTSFTEYDTVN